MRRVLSSLVAMALVVATAPMAAVADEAGKEDVGSPTEEIVSASSSDGSVSGAGGARQKAPSQVMRLRPNKRPSRRLLPRRALRVGLAWSLRPPTRRPQQMIKSDNAGMYALRVSDRQAYLLGECVGYSRPSLASSSNAVLVPDSQRLECRQLSGGDARLGLSRESTE